MSHHFVVPTNENGMSLDQYIVTDMEVAMKGPFQFGHVFLYSHGWWTNAIHAMEGYNRFTIEFSRFFRSTPALIDLPVLSVGIHWPSTLTEDEVSIDNYFQALSFYTMEKRADAVGSNATYTLLRVILDAWTGQPQPLNIHLLGHSFGAKVVCAALERLVEQSGAKPIPANVVFDLALLEAAFDNDELESQNDYGRVAGALPGLRLLVTHSDLDTALSKLYPAAHERARLLGKFKPALGNAGPSPATAALFGGASEIDVPPGFTVEEGGLPGQLTVADLTKLHAANPAGAVKFSGHHSDIFYAEIYELLKAFYKLS
jgi:Alpha/beta hydrolase of unknown function (DUF900)